MKHFNTTHGMTNTSEYCIWASIKKRCLNPKNKHFKNYGGRGITICDRWLRFQNFYEDMGPRPSLLHSIDRKDNDGPYSPANCRWATDIEQNRNSRWNVRLHFQGVTKCMSEWAQLTGISVSVIHSRINYRGWTIRKALTVIPSRGRILNG